MHGMSLAVTPPVETVLNLIAGAKLNWPDHFINTPVPH